MKIRGFYSFKQNGKTILEGENLITLMGESFFMNRCINNHFSPIEYIMLGSSSVRPKKSDISLGNLTVKKRVENLADLNTKQIVMEASFEAKEVINTCEIGVGNDDVLISHDVFEKITSSFLEDSIGAVDVVYTFELTTGSIRKDFNKVANKDYTYWIAEPSMVVGVTEKDTECGCKRVSSIDSVESTPGSYYYSLETKNLYVHTSRNSNPNLENIIIETK